MTDEDRLTQATALLKRAAWHIWARSRGLKMHRTKASELLDEVDAWLDAANEAPAGEEGT